MVANMKKTVLFDNVCTTIHGKVTD